MEKLEKLDKEKRDCLYNAEEVNEALIVIEKMKDMEYVEELLSKEYKRLRKKVEELHEKMFSKTT
jgi:hypothetical protein